MITYLITNKINGKRYVGQTINELGHRWKQHISNSKNLKRSEPILASIRKYGADNFDRKILSRCSSIEELNHREEYYIRLFKSLTPIGYNVLPGGNNKKMRDETKKKLSIVHTGKKRGPHSTEHRMNLSKAHMGKKYGPLSEEHKLKISIANIGINSPMFGKKQSEKNKQATKKANTGNEYWVGRKHKEESKLKMSKNRKGKFTGENNPFFGKTHTEKSLDKMMKGMEKFSKKVFCFNNNTVYISISAAARSLNVDRRHIRMVINGKASNAKGFVFKRIRF